MNGSYKCTECFFVFDDSLEAYEHSRDSWHKVEKEKWVEGQKKSLVKSCGDFFKPSAEG